MRCDSYPSLTRRSVSSSPDADKTLQLLECGPLLQRRRSSREPESPLPQAPAASLTNIVNSTPSIVSPTHQHFLSPPPPPTTSSSSPWVSPNRSALSVRLAETANVAAAVASTTGGAEILAPLQQLLANNVRQQESSVPMSRGRFAVTQCTTLVAFCFACIILLFYYAFLNTLDLNRLAEALLNVTKLTYPTPPKP